MDTAGDGFFAAFDTPADAARCALAIVKAMAVIDIEVRIGIHTGECQVVDGKVAGTAGAIGAAVAALAEPSTVLATSTVRDLTSGSGLVFDDAGERRLKGIAEPWRLFQVRDGPGWNTLARRGRPMLDVLGARSTRTSRSGEVERLRRLRYVELQDPGPFDVAESLQDGIEGVPTQNGDPPVS